MNLREFYKKLRSPLGTTLLSLGGLILAFLGSGFTLILYLYSLGLSPRQLLSSAYVSLEVVSGVASSVGVILSIPLTALITAEVFTREKKSGKSA